MSSRLSRLIRMIRIVRGRSYPNVKDLCRTLQIKERTLYNDLRELKDDLGVDIQFDRNRRGYYLGNDATEANFITLTEDTAFVLLAAFELVNWFGGEDLAESLREVFKDEIILCLGDGDSDRQKMPALIMQEACTNAGLNKELFLGLCRACLKTTPVKITVCQSQTNGKDSGSDLPKSSAKNNQHLLIYPRYLFFAPHEWKLAYSDNGSSTPLEKMKLSDIASLDEIDNEDSQLPASP